MTAWLAYAETTDMSGNDWRLVLLALAAIAGAAILAMVPIGLARSRDNRQAGSIAMAALLWGLASAGGVAYPVFRQFKWSHERLLLIETGYYDPQNTSGAPGWPWGLWIALAVFYCILLGFSLARRGAGHSPPSQPLRG